ncbi:hypothetical protein NW762_001538 [Fusarium torreyae]|uniref:Uncharacterized protein n=1 Tax=Fusarium torreyae TaxID=1237075 RepID=A0A9W8VP13_9HYPO|nr:hypothetical protein NW762_001538 [Fusarium torreyae]
MLADGASPKQRHACSYVQSLLNTIKQKDEQLKAKGGDSRAFADDIDAGGADDDPGAGPLSASSHHDDSDVGPSASIAQSDLSLSPDQSFEIVPTATAYYLQSSRQLLFPQVKATGLFPDGNAPRI